MRLHRLLCRLGLHAFPKDTPSTDERVCPICLKRQTWLPGMGGSEIGCWTP